jgi:drug/metabolite transporter (DMT)-like permease
VLATVLLALAASLCWGTADFTAGLKARRVPLSSVLALAQGVGLFLAVPVVVASGRPFPGAGEALASLGAGAAVIVGLACFYRALATGTMSVVAPVAATGVAIPVLAGLAGGNHLAAIQAIGMLAAVFGVVLSSRHPGPGGGGAGQVAPGNGGGQVAAGGGGDGGGWGGQVGGGDGGGGAVGRSTVPGRRAHRDAIALALIAAVAFGLYFLLAHIGTRGGVGWLLMLANVTGVLGVLAIGALTRSPPRPPPRGDLVVLLLAGVLEFAATGLYGLANRHGQLSVVAVAGSLYPVATVLLARVVLRERLVAAQGFGVGLALVGVALIAG